MIPCHEFFSDLSKEGVDFFAGVPDSLLKDFCAYITDHTSSSNHIISANEGAALALAAGRFMATGRIGLVYLQNSGLGNLVNPLTSLTDPEVYSIPALLLIGWRGEPGAPDEPQHRKQGRVMIATLDAMEIPHAVLPATAEEASKTIAVALASARERSAPFALIVRKGTFAPYKLKTEAANYYRLGREDAIKLILDGLQETDVVVSTTGMTSREVFEHREASKIGHEKDFLTVGCMGHASQIALGVAVSKPERQVFCIDGDGAVLMHMGALPIIGVVQPQKFRHIVINNGAHDSVGGQPTAGLSIDLPAIAKACNYRWVHSTADPAEIVTLLPELRRVVGPALLEIKVKTGARVNLGRPTTTTHENKRDFMAYLQ